MWKVLNSFHARDLNIRHLAWTLWKIHHVPVKFLQLKNDNDLLNFRYRWYLFVCRLFISILHLIFTLVCKELSVLTENIVIDWKKVLQFMFVCRRDSMQNFAHCVICYPFWLMYAPVRFPWVICVLIQLHQRKSISRSIFSWQCNIIQIEKCCLSPPTHCYDAD